MTVEMGGLCLEKQNGLLLHWKCTAYQAAGDGRRECVVCECSRRMRAGWGGGWGRGEVGGGDLEVAEPSERVGRAALAALSSSSAPASAVNH